MILYFAGAESGYYGDILKEAGVQNVLESAYYLNYVHEPNELKFPGYLLDSGGFTLRKYGREMSVEKYADYLNKWNVPIAFNLDTADWFESESNLAVLSARTKTKLIPVYHYSDWVNPKTRDGIIQMSMDHDYISVAGLGAPSVVERGKFYEWVFSKVHTRARIHGLGATVISHILNFPFFSVDSTTWINAQKFGQWIEFKNGRIVKHQSLRVQAQRSEPKFTNVNVMTFEHKRFLIQSAKTFMEFAEYVTRLWESRGIVWK